MATLLLVLIYVAFVSLGLPDALLGAGWPVMQPELAVPGSFAGLLHVLISGGTILSSVLSSRLLRRFGTGRITAASVAFTALALFGFALAPSFGWLYCGHEPGERLGAEISMRGARRPAAHGGVKACLPM